MDGWKLEKVKKINWKHYFILKSIFSSSNKELTTPELIKKLEFYFDLYGVRFSNYEGTRCLLNRQLTNLTDIGLITKFSGASNTYAINPKYNSIIYSLVVGFFGILDLKEDK